MAEPAGAGLSAPGRVASPASVDGRAYFAHAAEAAEQALAAGRVEHDLAIAGRRVRVVLAGEELVDALLPPLEHLAADGDGEPDARILVWDGSSTGVGLPPPLWEPENADARGLVHGVDGGVVAFHNVHFGGVTLCDPATATALVFAESRRRIPWYERGSPLRAALHVLLPGPGRHLVHAGAVGTADAGVLVGGVSGSGKSTLTLACVEGGLGYGGDDYVVVTLDPEPTAHTLYTSAKVHPAELERLPGLAACVDSESSIAEKAVLRLGRCRAERVVPALRVRAAVFPRVRGHGPSELAPIRAAEAVRLLGPSTVIQMPHESADLLATTARLLRDVPAFRLELGASLDESVALVRGLVESA
jgi:hypothetical protein